MENQKLENLLNLALNATPEELEKSENLSVGYETEQGKWEVIVKYSGEPEIFENPENYTKEAMRKRFMDNYRKHWKKDPDKLKLFYM